MANNIQREAELVSRQILTQQLDATRASYIYSELSGLPSINGVTLKGDKTLAELGVQCKLTAGDWISIDSNGKISCTASLEYVNYKNLSHKPTINGITLDGTLTSTSLNMYTIAETNQIISNALSGVTSVDIKFLTTLPTTGVKGTIYFIPSTDPTTPTAFDQYVYLNDAWSKTGSFEINITSKLDKVSTATTNPQVYAKKADGTQQMIDLDVDAATEGNIPIYGEDGALIVGDPVNDEDAANKNYVDSSLTAKQNKLDNGYESLDKLPSINGEYLIGNKTSADLHITGGEGTTYTAGAGIDLTDNTISVNLGVNETALTTTDGLALNQANIKSSLINNDAGFLTEHQDISTLATKTELNTQITDISEQIPTAVSDLENDSGYITETAVDTKLATKQDVLTDGYNSLENIPTVGNIEISGNKALSDYNVYSKTEVDSAISTAVSDFTEIQYNTEYASYEELPETGTTGMIYFIPNSTTQKYDEYVWVNSGYEQLGPSDIDTKINTVSTAKVDKITEGSTKRAYIVDENNVQSSMAITGDGTSLLSDTAIDTKLATKQDKLTAGSYIYIDSDNKISATGTLAVVYDTIPDKPKINGVELVNDKSTHDLLISYNDLVDTPSIPTKVSDIDNDTGFITATDTAITSKQDTLIAGSYIYIAEDGKTISTMGSLAVDYTTIPNKPKINNVTVENNVTLSALSLYSKAEVDALITGITKFDYKVVTELPTTGVKGTIYLILNTSTNLYDEYIWLDNKYEPLGPSHIDMSGKVDKVTDGGALRAYVVKADNSQGVMSITGDGASLLTEHQDITGKLDKVTSTSSTGQIYGKLANGTQHMISYTNTGQASSIAQYNVDGGITLSEVNPTSNTHATSKSYVDSKLATKQAALTVGDNITIDSDNKISAKDTTNYTLLTSKPSINGTILTGNVTTANLNIYYNDLKDLPTIPTKTSQITNDSGFLTEHQDISGKQDKLIAGTNITIAADGKTISATGGSASYTAGDNIQISGNTISATDTTYTAGSNITIIDNVISATGSGGTTDYTALTNKPTINGKELTGNKTTADLEISYNDLTDKPTIPDVTTKLDKITDTTSNGSLYYTNSDGQSSLAVSPNLTSSAVVQRDSSSQIKVPATPTATNHATSKSYVDNALDGKQATLTAGTGISIVDNVISVNLPNADDEEY